MVGCTPDWLGVSRGSEVGAAAVSRSPVVDEAPLVAVRADGDVFASQQIVREPSEGALALSSTRSWPSLRCTSAAARFSSSCETLVAPSSGMTLPRRAASHARAACAGVHLLDDHLMVAVGRAHRFARRRAVFLREVIGDTFVTGSDTDENALLRAHRLNPVPVKCR